MLTGFLGRGARTRAVTTLGRGGSDLTATLAGAALGVAEVVVWKDVDGVLTADPRLAPSARPVPALTYDEATELAFFGGRGGWVGDGCRAWRRWRRAAGCGARCAPGAPCQHPPPPGPPRPPPQARPCCTPWPCSPPSRPRAGGWLCA